MSSSVDLAPPFDPAAWMAGRRVGHGVALGLAYAGHGADWCELTLAYDRRLVSDAGTGVLASGPIVSLIDTAATLAVGLARGGMAPLATLDLRLDYLRPARPARPITGRMECYRLARRVAFVRGVAHDGAADDPVAHAAGTFMLLENWL